MFAKKFLSFIGTLFMGSQLLSGVMATAADDLPICTGITTETVCIKNGSTGHYCVMNGNIYGQVSSGLEACEEKFTSGIHIFDGAGTKVDLSGSDSVTTEDLVMYDCDGGKCTRTYGYVLYNGNYYTIGADGNDVADSVTNTQCTDSDVGTLVLDDDVFLCLSEGQKTQQKIDESTAVKYYLLENKAGNNFNNAGDYPEKHIVVKASENIYSYVGNDWDYCELENNEIKPTFKDYCENEGEEDCAKITECTDGICTRTPAPQCVMRIGNDESSDCLTEGYYIGTLSGDDVTLTTNATPSKLFKCSNKQNCVEIKDAAFKVGYYKFAGQKNKYISCPSEGSCVAVDVFTTSPTNGCKGMEVGDIIKVSGTYKLCLSGDVTDGIVLNPTQSEPTSGLIDVSSEGIVFGQKADYYVTIDFSNGNALLSTKLTENIPKYKYTGKTMVVAARQEEAVCTAPTTIIEFKLDESQTTHNYYKKHVEYTSS